MYDLRFYSEYFFRARPELVELDHVEGLPDNKDKQQLMDESATAAKGSDSHRLAERIVGIQIQNSNDMPSPEHREGAQINSKQ